MNILRVAVTINLSKSIALQSLPDVRWLTVARAVSWTYEKTDCHSR
jgi:hypothetical protein